MPCPSDPCPFPEERATFENWGADGCHVFVGSKHVLTLNTPESSKCNEAYRDFIEEWISPDDFCAYLNAVLRAFGASAAVVALVERERRNYCERPIEPPQRTQEDFLREVEATRE